MENQSLSEKYKFCLVGNIINKHSWEEEKKILSGTKHFRAGAKVYCALIYGGMGHKRILVLGKPRKSFRMVKVVMPTAYVKNFRLEKVYSPRILRFIDKYPPILEENTDWLESWKNHTSKEIKE